MPVGVERGSQAVDDDSAVADPVLIIVTEENHRLSPRRPLRRVQLKQITNIAKNVSSVEVDDVV